jgi:hypothetical protein
MRTAVTLAVGLAVALVCVAIAAANADVRLTNGALIVAVQNVVAGADGDHGIIIEGFKEQGAGGRDGWRVRQDSFGRPALVENDADCSGNVLFNDVVCTGARGSAVVTGGDGRDLVVFSETRAGQEVGTVNVVIIIGPFSRTVPLPDVNCTGTTREEGPANVSLGIGADFLAVVAMIGPNCGVSFPGAGSFLARLDARGGPGTDAMLGGPAADTLRGDGDGDVLWGAGGNDTLEGGAGNDVVEGNAGRDILRGDADQDRLFARDGGFDEIACGPGIDIAEGDLADFFVPTRPATVPPTFTNIRNPANASDCEITDTMPIDDGPPGHAVGRTLRRASDGTGTIRVACPRDARVTCRGTLTVRLGRAYGPVIARGRYTVARGKQTSVRVALGSARRGAKVFVHTVEQGVSKKGPRYSQRLLLIR